MTDIRRAMPLLARHEGEWEGTYTYIDNDGTILDQHQSHLTCTFPPDGEHAYYQINRYIWPDGRTEEHHFPATYRDGRIWWDTDRITGWAADVDLDQDKRTTMLTWTRKDMPGHYLYEMIQLSSCGNKRARTWHWFKDEEIYQRTIIKERRVR